MHVSENQKEHVPGIDGAAVCQCGQNARSRQIVPGAVAQKKKDRQGQQPPPPQKLDAELIFYKLKQALHTDLSLIAAATLVGEQEKKQQGSHGKDADLNDLGWQHFGISALINTVPG